MFDCPHCHMVTSVSKSVDALSLSAECPACGQPLLLGAPVAVDAASLSLLLAQPVLVVVCFQSAQDLVWPLFAPTFAVAAQDMSGQVIFAVVDAAAYPELVALHAIEQTPTLLLYQNATELDRFSGIVPLGQLKWWLSRYL